MKVYDAEVDIFNRIKVTRYPKLSNSQMHTIEGFITLIRERRTKISSMIIDLVPFVVYFFLFVMLLISVKSIESSTLQILLLSIGHGILGYFFVIYTLHLGAGHGLMKNSRILKWLAFNSSRILFADPVYYKSIHSKHHNYLGTSKDLAFTHFILIRRFFVSILPGAGILYKNDFCVHTDSKISSSLVTSLFTGVVFLILEIYILKTSMSIYPICLSLLLIGPWIGMILDRFREIAEHHNMPADRIYGSRELGLKGMMFFIVGGPFGQPYHFSHHFAPDFNWLEQLKLHGMFQDILDRNQKEFYGFKCSSIYNYKDIYLRLTKEGKHV